MSERREHRVHTIVVVPGKESGPLCGAPDPGPIPFGDAIKIMPCPDCAEVGPEGIPFELTIAFQAQRVRQMLENKMRDMSEADRATYKEQIVSIGSAALADPESAPALWSTSQLLAALYAYSSMRAGWYQLRRSGVPPSWALLEAGLREMEMVTVALAEGTPL